jgi:hypothetical protein
MICARTDARDGISPVRSRGRQEINELSFCAWVAQAEPGERLQYHIGFLAVDTFTQISGLSEKERTELGRLSDRAFRAAALGLVHLVQERIGPDCFAYFAIARARPKSVNVSLSALLLDERAA